jgi:hypothetical protein
VDAPAAATVRWVRDVLTGCLVFVVLLIALFLLVLLISPGIRFG